MIKTKHNTGGVNVDKCLYNAHELYADDVAKTFAMEEKIRNAVGQLYCSDPECHAPVIYKHGKAKRAHFAHKNSNDVCCYDTYSKNLNEFKRNLRDMLYEQLNSIGVTCSKDVRISKEYKHISELGIQIEASTYLIDILNPRTYKTMAQMREHYAKNHAIAVPLIIDTPYFEPFNLQQQSSSILKYWLQYSQMRNVLVYSAEWHEFYLCKYNDKHYDIPHITRLYHVYFKDTYITKIDIKDLKFDTVNGFTTFKFEGMYQAWLNDKEKQVQEYKRAEAERQKNLAESRRKEEEALRIRRAKEAEDRRKIAETRARMREENLRIQAERRAAETAANANANSITNTGRVQEQVRVQEQIQENQKPKAEEHTKVDEIPKAEAIAPLEAAYKALVQEGCFIDTDKNGKRVKVPIDDVYIPVCNTRYVQSLTATEMATLIEKAIHGDVVAYKHLHNVCKNMNAAETNTLAAYWHKYDKLNTEKQTLEIYYKAKVICTLITKCL